MWSKLLRIWLKMVFIFVFYVKCICIVIIILIDINNIIEGKGK